MRLTNHDPGYQPLAIRANEPTWRSIYDKLSAYEGTGYSPLEISSLEGEWNAMRKVVDSYRAAEERGLLVRLPCKVGDTVFVVEGHSVYKSKVDSITLRDDGVWLDSTFNHFGLVYCSGEIGRNVFLTREEAETALKGETEDV